MVIRDRVNKTEERKISRVLFFTTFLLATVMVFAIGETGVVTIPVNDQTKLYLQPSRFSTPLGTLDRTKRATVTRMLNLSENTIFGGRWYYCKSETLSGWTEEENFRLSPIEETYLEKANYREFENRSESERLSARIKLTFLDYRRFREQELSQFGSPKIVKTELTGFFQDGNPVTIVEFTSNSLRVRWTTWLEDQSYLTLLEMRNDSKYWSKYLPEFSNMDQIVSRFGIASDRNGWLDYSTFHLKIEGEKLQFRYEINTGE